MTIDNHNDDTQVGATSSTSLQMAAERTELALIRTDFSAAAFGSESKIMQLFRRSVVMGMDFKDTLLQLEASSMTSHVVRQTSGFLDHVGNR